MKKMIRSTLTALCIATCSIALTAMLPLSASATTLYSDLFEYYDDGTIIQYDVIAGTSATIRGPVGPAINGVPTGTLLLKIEEDVIQYDPVVHPSVTPGQDRYVYTISNLGYDSGNVPLSPGNTPGVGINGLSGFNIVNQYGVVTTAWGVPNDPVTLIPWVYGGFSGPGNWEWDIVPPGEGIGSPNPGSPLSMDGFWFEVASGTQHGLVPMWVHSWDATPVQVNIWDLIVSGPVPEPGTLSLLLLGGLALAMRFRRP